MIFCWQIILVNTLLKFIYFSYSFLFILYLFLGLRTGAAPEVAQMMRDKYDTELELAKALMQQEFDESLEGEQVIIISFV